MPSAQGKAPVQAPALETKLSPAGVTSATETPLASLGPALVIVIVYTMLVPGTTLAGPVRVRPKSADPGLTVVGAKALLLAATASPVGELTVAALTIGFAPPYPAGTR